MGLDTMLLEDVEGGDTAIKKREGTAIKKRGYRYISKIGGPGTVIKKRGKYT